VEENGWKQKEDTGEELEEEEEDTEEDSETEDTEEEWFIKEEIGVGDGEKKPKESEKNITE